MMAVLTADAHALNSRDVGCDYMSTSEFVVWHFAAILASFFLALPSARVLGTLLSALGLGKITGGGIGAIIGGGGVAYIVDCGIGGWMYFSIVAWGVIGIFIKLVGWGLGSSFGKNEWESMTKEEFAREWEICCARRDRAGADMWLKRAAEAGIAEAQAELGVRCMRKAETESDLRGESLSKSPYMAESIKWFCRAAESGHKDAQQVLDNIRHAAKQGDADAQEMLRVINPQ